MIAIAQQHALKRTHELLRESEPPILIHHQNAHAIAHFEHLRRRRVVRHAIRVDAHLFELLQAELKQRIGNGDAHTGVVLVIADAFENDVFSVEEEAFVPCRT